MTFAWLSESTWKRRQAAHKARLHAWLEPQLARRSNNKKHPVIDFLFEYYSFRPGALLRWGPGANIAMGGDARSFLEQNYYRAFDEGIGLSSEDIPAKRRSSAAWILNLLQRTEARPPIMGCHGLHEWAMVYDSTDARHDFPLRLPEVEIQALVDEHPVCCSHFDAFRFFSKSAKPKNMLQPGRDTRPEFEQPGCLHANMDLYKWGFKLYPWLPSELIADAFEDALKAREVDMRASPYDFTELGYEPIKIETEDGRKQYEREQRLIMVRGQALRRRLISAIEKLLANEPVFLDDPEEAFEDTQSFSIPSDT